MLLKLTSAALASSSLLMLPLELQHPRLSAVAVKEEERSSTLSTPELKMVVDGREKPWRLTMDALGRCCESTLEQAGEQ